MRSLFLLATAGYLVSCARTPAPPIEQQVARDASVVTPAREAARPPAAPDFGDQFVAAANLIRPSLVSIRAGNFGRGDANSPLEGTPLEPILRGLPMQRTKPDRRNTGSGVVIDDSGNILTSSHVVEGSSSMRIRLLDGRELPARVVGSDAKTDLAVVKAAVGRVKLQPASLADSDKVQLGQWVMTSGAEASLRQTAYVGTVNAVGRGSSGLAEAEDFIQTDAAAHPGASGGPLVDRSGRVVGISTTVAADSSKRSAAIGFAVPINMARSVMEQLIAHGRVVRGDIGVYFGNVSDELAHSFGYRGSGGALVQDVVAEGPGARAGVQPGDIIVQRNGQPVKSAADLRNGIASLAPGSKTQLRIFRDGEQRTLDVEVQELPAVATEDGAITGEQPRWGLELADFTPELRERLNLEETQHGAVIMQVSPNSPADDAGLRPADLVTSIGDYEVHDADQARRLLLTAKLPVRLRIVHDGRGSFVILNSAD